MNTNFEWDEDKNADNIQKHEINFETAQYAFIDPGRIIAEDLAVVRKKNVIIVLEK